MVGSSALFFVRQLVMRQAQKCGVPQESFDIRRATTRTLVFTCTSRGSLLAFQNVMWNRAPVQQPDSRAFYL